MAASSSDVFVKRPKEPGAAEAEAVGLQWLGEAVSDAVATVLEVQPHRIVTKRVVPARPTSKAAYQAGINLARIHAAGAEAFGAPPSPAGISYVGQNYIGTQPQECTPADTWSDFYWNQRVWPFVVAAREAGNLTEHELDLMAEVGSLVLAVTDSPAVARIHGDLWAGNLLYGESGPVMIDPAAHGGAGLTDIAMLYLFGAPHMADLVAGYETVTPLPAGWTELIPLHTLHPLAVHATTHGRSYGRELVDVAYRVRSVLRG